MAIYYSTSTGGFYDEDIVGLRAGSDSLIPVDAVLVSAEDHRTLLEAQANGQVIVAGAAGEPIAVDRPAPTLEQSRAILSTAIQKMLDTKAASLGFDGMQSAVTYADEPAVPTFQNQGAALRAWRSLVWAACYALLAEVESGAKPVPTVDQLLAAMPACTL